MPFNFDDVKFDYVEDDSNASYSRKASGAKFDWNAVNEETRWTTNLEALRNHIDGLSYDDISLLVDVIGADKVSKEWWVAHMQSEWNDTYGIFSFDTLSGVARDVVNKTIPVKKGSTLSKEQLLRAMGRMSLVSSPNESGGRDYNYVADPSKHRFVECDGDLICQAITFNLAFGEQKNEVVVDHVRSRTKVIGRRIAPVPTKEDAMASPTLFPVIDGKICSLFDAYYSVGKKVADSSIGENRFNWIVLRRPDLPLPTPEVKTLPVLGPWTGIDSTKTEFVSQLAKHSCYHDAFKLSNSHVFVCCLNSLIQIPNLCIGGKLPRSTMQWTTDMLQPCRWVGLNAFQCPPQAIKRGHKFDSIPQHEMGVKCDVMVTPHSRMFRNTLKAAVVLIPILDLFLTSEILRNWGKTDSVAMLSLGPTPYLWLIRGSLKGQEDRPKVLGVNLPSFCYQVREVVKRLIYRGLELRMRGQNPPLFYELAAREVNGQLKIAMDTYAMSMVWTRWTPVEESEGIKKLQFSDAEFKWN